MGSKQQSLLALYASVVLLALNGLFAKLIPLDAGSMSQMRSVVACIALSLFLLLQRRRWRLLSIKSALGVYALGVLLGLHWVTYFHAMQVSTVAIGMLSLFCYPVITVVIEPLFHRSFPKPIDLLAAFAVFMGVAVMASEGVFASNNLDKSSVLLGAAWGVCSALIFSLRNTIQKYCFHHIDSASLMTHQVSAVAILAIPFVDLTSVNNMARGDWSLLIALGIFSTAAAHTLLTFSLKGLKAKSVAMIGCTLPLCGSILAWLVLGEIPSKTVFIGGSIILAVATYESIKQSKPVETST